MIDLENTFERNILNTIDLLEREIEVVKNALFFYIYDDGTVEKMIVE